MTDLGMLLLHALPLDNRMWDDQRQLMPDRTHAPDLYAFGDNITDWAAQSLNAAAQDWLIVVGCSVGGSCALEVLNLAPDRVAAVVLIGTKARCNFDPAALAQGCDMITEQGIAAAWDSYWQRLFAPTEKGAMQAAKEIALQQSQESLTNGLKAFHTRPNREDVVSESAVPIHVVTGDRDPLPGLPYSTRLAGLSDKAQLHVIPDSGHYLPMTKPQALNAVLEDVVAKLSTKEV